MHSNFRRVALIGKYQVQAGGALVHKAVTVLTHIADFLRAQGCEVVLEQTSAQQLGLTDRYPSIEVSQIGADCDLGVVVGGDGTMLGIARQLAPYGTPLIGVNQGRLGFITDISLDGYEAKLAPMLQGAYEEDSRPLMSAQVFRHESTLLFETLAMNDVVVNRSATAGMVELRVRVNGRFVANQRADGLIVASPTGSTAYALSAGGPMLHPAIPGWVMVPIAPHTLSNRPIVLPDSAEIAIEIVNGRDTSANFDMQSLASLQPGDRILVKRSEHSVRFLHPLGWNYFSTLRKKLRWNEGEE